MLEFDLEVNGCLNKILKCIICNAENLENAVKYLMEEVKVYTSATLA